MLQRVNASDKGYKLLQPKDLTPENLPIDVHTWKWYFACGQKYLVVGTGVRTKGYSRRKLRHMCMYRYSVNTHPTCTTPITHVDAPPSQASTYVCSACMDGNTP